ncbi:protodermal factor 1 [Rhodamnia argentea]|uniref:Protodermal factor 1 n=1 Tax=Rhodamnia argentea TaxID=178133 RepID=A0A8B8PAX9_9MYRT|nr:protodermal factor 1 [Rhodamnia argentea]
MDYSMHRLLFTALLILASAIDGTRGDAMVTGTVFCDQCKDGQRSLFDYPIYGIKVMVACANSDGQVTMSGEETTNWFGNYAMRFDGTPDLSRCYAQVMGGSSQGSAGCSASAGPAQSLRLTFRLFDMEFYSVDSLLSQPAQPMSFCPQSPAPVTPAVPSPPAFKLPPTPPLPPAPFLEASACPHEEWMMPAYKCYWRAVNPDTKVALVFGLLAARRYGTDVTLWQGLKGRGDPYRTLLREGTTAFLNSYNSIQFPYHTLGVIQHVNWALMGSTQDVLLTALRFKRANSGYGTTTCKFTPCK